MTRRRTVLVAIAVAAAIAIVPAAPAATGAWFTAAAGPVPAASVTTGSLSNLTGGASDRTTQGAAGVRWTTPPEGGRAYTVERSVGATRSTFTPTVSDTAGSTGFVDDLTVPVGSGCASGWVAAPGARCAPGTGIVVSYRISSRFAAWAPPSDLIVTTATAAAPALSAGPIAPDPDAPNEASATFTVTNSSAVGVPVRVTTPMVVGAGGLVHLSTRPGLATNGCDPSSCFVTGTVPPGSTVTVYAAWRDAPRGATLRFTVSSPQGPDREVTFVAP